MKLCLNKISVGLLSASIILVTLSAPAFAKNLTSGEMEVKHTQAILDFHSKNYSKAQQNLREILTQDPKHISALELMALVQKESGQEKAAEETYRNLISFADPEKKPAYQFELGVLQYKALSKQKDEAGKTATREEARENLSYAVKKGFNPGMSSFFLGMMDFETQNWKAAVGNFSVALDNKDAESMYSIAQYYLSLSYSRQGRVDAAVRNFHTAAITVPTVRNEALQKLSRDLRRNAINELRALDSSQWYATGTLLGQWDSNVQTNPSDTYNPLTSSMQRSWKNAVNLSFGFTTSPVRMFQFMPSYRLYTNYNYNTQARDFNFFTHGGGFYLLFKPYKKISFGLKVDANYTMKNDIRTGDSYNKVDFRSFSLVSDIGVVGRIAFTPRTSLVVEATGRPKRYYNDPLTGTSRRTGNGTLVKSSFEHVSGLSWWNPYGSASFEWDNAEGSNFVMYSWGASVADTVQPFPGFLPKLSITQSFDYLGTNYYRTSPNRSDDYFSMRTLFSYSFTSSIGGMTDIMYVRNSSTIPASYKYSRILASFGLSYTF